MSEKGPRGGGDFQSISPAVKRRKVVFEGCEMVTESGHRPWLLRQTAVNEIVPAEKVVGLDANDSEMRKLRQVRRNMKDPRKNALKIYSPITASVSRLSIKLADSNEVLCERCEALDIDDMFAPMERHSIRGQEIAALGSIGDISATESCSLCRPFATVRIKDAMLLDNRDYRLQCLYFLEATRDVYRHGVSRNIQVLDCICLAVVPRSIQISRNPSFKLKETGVICLAHSAAQETARFSARALQPDTIDFQLLKGWIAL